MMMSIQTCRSRAVSLCLLTTRNILIYDPLFSSLNRHYSSFVTILWRKTNRRQSTVSNQQPWPFLRNHHRRLWRFWIVTNLWRSNFVTSCPATPHQIIRGLSYVACHTWHVLCGMSYVALLWRNQIIVNQNQPDPLRWFVWTQPNNFSLIFNWASAF